MHWHHFLSGNTPSERRVAKHPSSTRLALVGETENGSKTNDYLLKIESTYQRPSGPSTKIGLTSIDNTKEIYNEKPKQYK